MAVLRDTKSCLCLLGWAQLWVEPGRLPYPDSTCEKKQQKARSALGEHENTDASGKKKTMMTTKKRKQEQKHIREHHFSAWQRPGIDEEHGLRLRSEKGTDVPGEERRN